jgi:hypothetical protein
MFQFFAESTTLFTARMMFGDEYVAEKLFSQEYDPGFVSRHPNQLAGLWESQFDYDD